MVGQQYARISHTPLSSSPVSIPVGLSAVALCLGVACGKAEDPTAFELVVSDSIGSETGSVTFSRVPSACVLETGEIAVLDSGNSTLWLFSENGDSLKATSIEGGGPGEFYSANCVTPAPGSGVWLSSFYDRKMVLLDDTLGLQEDVVLVDPEYCTPLVIVSHPSGELIGRFQVGSVDSSGTAIAMLNEDGSLDQVFRRTMVLFDQTGTRQAETSMVAAAGQNGLVYIAPQIGQEYHIYSYATDGSLVKDICIPEIHMQPKPAEVIALERDHAMANWISATGSADGFAYEPPQFYNMIEYLGTDSLGRIWALRGDYTNPTFDVFSPDGQREFTCTTSLPSWQECDRWLFYIGEGGFLAMPYNPDRYPLVYILRLQEVAVQQD